MKIKLFLLLVAGVMSFSAAHAQCEFITPAVPDISLTFVSMDGTNASGVTFNPDDSLYYALIAGNATYPLETFSKTGTPLAQAIIGFDSRGLWWNPEQHQAEINGYDAGGLYIPDLDPNGYLLGTGINPFTGMNQPNAQSCGAFDWGDNEIIYYDNGSIYRYDRLNCNLLGSFALTGFSNWTNVNSTSVIFTGCGGKEIGVLDYVNKQVLLFRKADGSLAMTIDLPSSAITNSMFRFAYANGRVWLYDIVTRTWYAYRMVYESGVGIEEPGNTWSIVQQDQELRLMFREQPLSGAYVSLCNAPGQEISRRTNPGRIVSLPLNNSKPGLYFVRYYTGQQMFTKKIILH